MSHVFWTAFKALPKIQQNAFLSRLCADEGTRSDLMDMAVIESRRHEKSRPFGQYLATYHKKTRH